MKYIENKFSRIFRYMGIFDHEIYSKASFKKDYEFNDFQFACLVFYIEKYFNVNISPEDYIHLDTVGSTIEFVYRKLK